MDDFVLTYGPHKFNDGTCLMEAVAILGGELKSDEPVCACPVLSSYGRGLNDAMGREEEGNALRGRYLAPLVPLLVGTRSTPEVEAVRARVLVLAFAREITPVFLRAACLAAEADRLTALPDEATCVAIKEAVAVVMAQARAVTVTTPAVEVRAVVKVARMVMLAAEELTLATEVVDAGLLGVEAVARLAYATRAVWIPAREAWTAEREAWMVRVWGSATEAFRRAIDIIQ